MRFRSRAFAVAACLCFVAASAPHGANAFGQRVRHGSGNGGTSSAVTPDGFFARIAFVSGVVSDQGRASDFIACVQIEGHGKVDRGCTLEEQWTTFDAATGTWDLHVLIPSEVSTGNIGVDVTFRPLEGGGTKTNTTTLYGTGANNFVQLEAQAVQVAKVTGLVFSDHLRNDDRYGARGDSYAGLFQGGNVEIAVGDDPNGESGGIRQASTHHRLPMFNRTFQPNLSGDGRYVSFTAHDGGYPGDTNNTPDIFRHDLLTGTTERVSLHADGSSSGASSGHTVMSRDGGTVAFNSLDCLASCGAPLGIFVRDIATGTIRLAGSGEAPTLAYDGSVIAWMSYPHRGTISYTGRYGDGSFPGVHPQLSDSGRWIAYLYDPVGPGHGVYEGGALLVRDLANPAQPPVRVDVSSGGAAGDGIAFSPSITDDGRYVVFASSSSNLVPGDGNGAWDVFLRDRDTDADGILDEPGATSIVRISLSNNGYVEGDGSSGFAWAGNRSVTMSLDARYIAFNSAATNLSGQETRGKQQVYVHDRLKGTTKLVSLGLDRKTGADGDSWMPALDATGRRVAFMSDASDVIAAPAQPLIDPNPYDERYQVYVSNWSVPQTPGI